MNSHSCPFCAEGENLFSNAQALVRRDLNPVTPGHVLIMTRRHVADFFETTSDERTALLELLQEAKAMLQQHHAPDGFNVGINIGSSAVRQFGRADHSACPHSFDPALCRRHAQSARRCARSDSRQASVLIFGGPHHV